jgi:NDP-hexose-3-ketoreductase
MGGKIRVGILGCANIAEKYAISAFKSLPEVQLVCIASRSEDTARMWAQKHGLEAESYESLIKRTDIDVIYSPLPIGLQAEWVSKAALAGKHVICEKSITYSLESAERMVEVCKQNSVALYENFVPPFHPQHQKISALISEGAIGTVRSWNGAYGFPPFPKQDIRYRADLKGGSLNDCGCYLLFMSRKILEAEPVAVTCSLWNDGTEVDIRGTAMVEFPGNSALMSFGFDQLYQNTYSVWGSKGILSTKRAFAIPPTLAPTVELIENDGTKETVLSIEVPATDQFSLSFRFFAEAILKNDSDRIDQMYAQILSQARAMEAMRISAREYARVRLDEI